MKPLSKIKKKMKTGTLTILFITIFLCNKTFSQFAFNNIEFKLKNTPSSSYKIFQIEKGKLKKNLQFNKDAKIIFNYRETEIPSFFNWKKSHRFIYANENDGNGRIVKRYDFEKFINDTDHLEHKKLRIKNLFYVSCSRAKENLVVLALSQMGDSAMNKINEWFGSENIDG